MAPILHHGPPVPAVNNPMLKITMCNRSNRLTRKRQGLHRCQAESQWDVAESDDWAQLLKTYTVNDLKIPDDEKVRG